MFTIRHSILKTLGFAAFVCALFAINANSAAAQDSGLFPPPAQAENNAMLSPVEITHPPLRLTQDRSEIVDLPEPIGRIIVGNDANANILMDTAQRIVVVPREVGATFFTIMDQDGNVIMQRHVIVGSPRENYVRLRRSCALTDGGECSEMDTYYCADMCHMITVSEDGEEEDGGSGLSESAMGEYQGGSGELPPEFYESGYQQQGSEQ